MNPIKSKAGRASHSTRGALTRLEHAVEKYGATADDVARLRALIRSIPMPVPYVAPGQEVTGRGDDDA